MVVVFELHKIKFQILISRLMDTNSLCFCDFEVSKPILFFQVVEVGLGISTGVQNLITLQEMFPNLNHLFPSNNLVSL